MQLRPLGAADGTAEELRFGITMDVGALRASPGGAHFDSLRAQRERQHAPERAGRSVAAIAAATVAVALSLKPQQPGASMRPWKSAEVLPRVCGANNGAWSCDVLLA